MNLLSALCDFHSDKRPDAIILTMLFFICGGAV